MKRAMTVRMFALMSMALLLFSGCQGNRLTAIPQMTETVIPDNNGLINGWLSTYDQYVNETGMVTFDWSSYQPATGTALICYEHQYSDDLCQHTSVGNYVMESIEKERIYRFAIWYGDAQKINSIMNGSIPEYAWHYFCVTRNKEIVPSTQEDFFRTLPAGICNYPTPTPSPRQTITPTARPTPRPTVRPIRRLTAVPKPTETQQPTAVPDYSWYLQFTGINADQYDNYTMDNNMRVEDTVYFHAHLSGGAPYEEILPYFEICMNGELIDSSAFSCSFGDNSDIWVRNTPYRYGTLSIRIFYYANNGDGREIDLGSTSIHINARDDNTQTETAKGWISDCDVYFDRYGNLCFDLTNYNSSDKAIIWFSQNETSDKTVQGSVSGGQIVWDSPVPGLIYEYAIWCGSSDYSRDVAALSKNQIPSSAWIKLCVTEDQQIVIVSSDVAINIKQNE